MKKTKTSPASAITKAASKQTFYTIRFLVDRERVEDAYRAYAYFRWVDDVLDADSGSGPVPSDNEVSQRKVFLERQKSIFESCLRGEIPQATNIQENMLVELILSNPGDNSGLRSYIRNMMKVMDFDVRRRGRLISQFELNEYTRWLAIAVTEALNYFIGHGEYTPHDETRFLAVSAAHVIHMLRDTFDDMQSGYFNIPFEMLDINHIGSQDVHSWAYRAWVKSRVQLARKYFQAGRSYFMRVPNWRHRLAGFAYIARFEWLLERIERERFILRPHYSERKSIGTGLKIGWNILSSMISLQVMGNSSQPIASQRQGK